MARIGVVLEKDLTRRTGGIEESTYRLVSELFRLDQANEYVLIKDRLNPSFPGRKFIPFPMPRTPFQKAVKLGWFLPSMVKKHGLDIVHDPSPMGPFWRRSKAKYVLTVHDLFPLTHPKLSTSRVATYVYRYFFPTILRNADAVVCSSFFSAKLVEKYYSGAIGESRLHVVPLGVDLKKSNLAATSRIHPGKHSPYFLFVGNLNPRKNVVTIIKGFDAFCQRNTEEVRLVIAGTKGWGYEEIFEAIKRSRYKSLISYLGFVSEKEKFALLRNAVALLYPSLSEGFGIPILEAFACKTPVIVSRVASIPEVAGEAAFYLDDPLDFHDLSRLMEKAFFEKDLVRELVRLGVGRLKRFTWEKSARFIISIYKEILRENSPN